MLLVLKEHDYFVLTPILSTLLNYLKIIISLLNCKEKVKYLYHNKSWRRFVYND